MAGGRAPFPVVAGYAQQYTRANNPKRVPYTYKKKSFVGLEEIISSLCMKNTLKSSTYTGVFGSSGKLFLPMARYTGVDLQGKSSRGMVYTAGLF